MRWFGESWGGLVCEESAYAPTPVGASCARCGALIASRDRGFLIPHLVGGETVYHLDCFAKSMGIAPPPPRPRLFYEHHLTDKQLEEWETFVRDGRSGDVH